MHRTGLTVAGMLTLLAFCVGFVGVAVGLNLTQPTDENTDAVIHFQVRPGDGVSSVAKHLEQDGLIRSGLVFQAAGRAQRLDAHLQPGTYELSPGMTMGDILKRLLDGNPDQPIIIVPPGQVLASVPAGSRVTQFPQYFSGLSNFHADSFLKIAKTGTLPDGKRLSDVYWYVSPPHQGTFYALEGYLLPDNYFLGASSDEVAAVNQMLTALGERLCPGPNGHPDAFLHDPAQCKAHAATVGPKHANIFAEMEQHYATTNDTQALYDTLIVASLAARVSSYDSDAALVTSVYYNRYLAGRNHTFAPSGDYVQNLGSDAAIQYARDSDTPPKDGNWWSPLTDQAANIESDSPYNTAIPDNTDLIPGPIAAPTWADIVGAATANEPAPSPYYFVAADRCGHAHYAKSLAEFLVMSQRAGAGCYNQ